MLSLPIPQIKIRDPAAAAVRSFHCAYCLLLLICDVKPGCIPAGLKGKRPLKGERTNVFHL